MAVIGLMNLRLTKKAAFAFDIRESAEANDAGYGIGCFRGVAS